MCDVPWVRVLGPIDVSSPARDLAVGGRRQRALLGALAVGAGRAVPIDQLLQAVWNDHPPRTAANSLQSHISHLRELLGVDAVELVDHAYRLDLDLVRIDAIEFARYLRLAESEPDAETRSRLTRDALDLWRGHAFGDLRDDELFRLEAIRLDELRLSAMELNLAAELELGRIALAVAELETIVREHPYRERLWRLLVEALVLADRRVEALRACQQWRSVLAEVGLEPTDSLIDAEQHVLTG